MKQIITQDRKAMIDAVTEAANMIATTMGPNPNVVTVAMPGGGISINDGVQILKTLCPVNRDQQRLLVDRDPMVDLGYDRLIRAAESTLRQAGDGTSSTAVIFAKLLVEAEKAIADEGTYTRSQLADQILADAEFVVAQINDIARSGENVDTLKAVASIAMHGHPWAPKIAELLWDLGIEGTFTVEVAPDGHDFTTEKVSGFQWGAGTLPECFNEKGKFDASASGAYVGVIGSEVADVKDIKGLLEAYSGLQTPGSNPRTWVPLVLVCSNMTGNAKSSFLAAQIPHGNGYVKAPFVLVGLPKGADYEQIRDVAAVVGSAMFDRTLGVDPAKQVEATDLGFVPKAIVTARSSMFVPVPDNKEMETRIADLEEMFSSATGEDKERLSERLSRLRGKYGVIKVPVTTESEFGYVKEMVEDGYRAVQSAMEHGVVPGGGWMLFWISMSAKSETTLMKSIRAPRVALVNKYCKDWGDGEGLDFENPWAFATLINRKQADALKAGIIDNAASVKSAVMNAAKEAALLIKSEYFIVNDQRV